MDKITPEQWAKVRAWLYGLSLATLPLLLHYGLIDPVAVPLFAGLVLALFNVSTGNDSQEG